MNQLILKVQEEIDELHLSKKLLVVGVSGGPDSVALVTILKFLGLNIHIAHLNHDLRGEESEKDANFVKEIAKKLSIPYTIEKRTIPSTGSLQEEARKVRYDFLKEVCQEKGTDVVILGQHGDDQLETVLMNFFRGASLTGLAGIKKVSKYNGLTLVRPLLKSTKKEILDFLADNGFKYRIDSSNKKDKYLRNRYRLKIIPFLEENLGYNFKETILTNSEIINLEDDYLKEEANLILNNLLSKKENHPQYDIVLDSSLNKHHKAMIARVIRMAIARNYNIREFTSRNILDIVEACLVDKPMRINLPCGVIFTKWSNNLAFYREKNFQISKETVKIDLNEVIVFGNKELVILKSKKGPPTHEFSGDNLKFPLIIRSRKEGDRISISTGGTKKLKDLFIDAKTPRHERDFVPILTDSNDNLVSVVGYRVNPEHYIKETTLKKLYLYVNGLEEDKWNNT